MHRQTYLDKSISILILYKVNKNFQYISNLFRRKEVICSLYKNVSVEKSRQRECKSKKIKSFQVKIVKM